MFTVKISHCTRLFLRAGPSFAQLKRWLNVKLDFPTFPFAERFFSHSSDITGVMLGLGIDQAITKSLHFFAEYIYYDYGRKVINHVFNLGTGLGTFNTLDELESSELLRTSSIFVGFNYKVNL